MPKGKLFTHPNTRKKDPPFLWQPIYFVFFLLLSFGLHTSAQESCPSLYDSLKFEAPKRGPIIWGQKEKQKAYQIMTFGSSNVSRTVALGRRFIAPATVSDGEITTIAKNNFNKAVRYVLDNHESLEINLDTATKLNMMLTEGLVPKQNMGNYRFRVNASYSAQAESFVKGDPKNFYDWLESLQAKKLFKRDPVKFAEVVHNNLVALDSFPDGNGRLSRLLSDLALIKAGYGPAFYTDMTDYFARGNARADVSREVRELYYREIVNRGQEAMRTALPRPRAPRAPRAIEMR